MSTQPKTHNNHHVNRATQPTNGGIRTPHPVQSRAPAPAPKSGSPHGGDSRLSERPAREPNIQPVSKPPAPRPQVQGGHKVTPVTQTDLKRMMSAVSKQHGGALPKDSYVAEMQSRFDKREAASSAKPPAPAPALKANDARREPLQSKGPGKR